MSFRVIDYKAMPYPTVGWWGWNGYRLQVRSARLSHRRYEWLVMAHETIEALLCWFAGVKEADVDAYDIKYEKFRQKLVERDKAGIPRTWFASITATSEPGDSLHAPYYRQHQIATAIERGLARVLLVDWDAYAKEVESL